MRLRRFSISFGAWVIVVGLSLPVCAADRPGAISGYVRNASGEPQMGAIVQILSVASGSLTVFTDGAGHYSATGLLPGLYSIKVTAPSFLPALREKVGLRAGASININVTLQTLLGMMQLGPVRAMPDDDDWKWTLRSVANRPILRVLDDPALSNEHPSHALSGSLAFFGGAGGSGFGSGSDMDTAFRLERSLFADSHLSFSGNVGYGDGVPVGVLRAGYARRLANGSQPSMGLTVRRFAASDPNLGNLALQAVSFSAGDEFSLGNVLELKFGSELQTIEFLGHVSAFRPHASADFHLSPNTLLEYSYSTSRPDARAEKGFDSAPADMSEADPRVAVANFSPKVESAHHQEISLSRRLGNTRLQVAAFSDRVGNTVLTGTGDVLTSGGYILPDVTSGTFSYAGSNLDTRGMRVVLQHRFSSDLTATVDYAVGGVLDLASPDVALQPATPGAPMFATQRRHALAAKLSGTLPATHTSWITSYRWVNGSALTPVDMFNASPGQSDPYLNVFIRQPIPILQGHVEAILDLRNLLAQGYVPVLGQDGQTVYLVQSARSIRGGVAFTF